MARWQRRSRDERGAVLVFVCIAMVALIGSAAMAVDIGRETLRNRHIESVADVVAFDAARAINGQTVSQLSAPTGAVTVAVQESATRNNFPYNQLAVDLGTFTNGAFTRQDPVASPAAVPTAVRVAASESTNFLFARGGITGSRSSSGSTGCGSGMACVVKQSTAGFSIGSWLASISSGDSALLSGLLGDAFHLNAVSYNGLLNSTLTLQQIGLNMPVTVLSPTQLLSTSVSIHDFMLASIAALNAQGNTTAANVLNSMILNASTTGTVKLGDFMTVAAGSETAAATASLDVLSILTASAMVMEKNGGHALSIPTTTVSVPGITSITASATVISPPVFYFGTAPGPTISTAQVRVTVTPVINLSAGSGNTACTVSLSNLLGLLGCLLNPLLPVGVTLNGSLPIDLTAASATANLSAINCATPSITVASTTQAVNLNAAANLNLDVTLLGSPLLNAARVNIAAGVKTTATPYTTTFNYPSEFGPSHTKSVGSSTLGLSGLLNVSSANISVLNGTLNTAAVSTLISGLVVPVLNSLLGSLDTALILPISRVLGAKFGGADIAALGMSCNTVRLVG
ncbi:MAG: hypothetical protein QOJ23_174 [Actinomycetota bacterium]|jgi:uncharacterized membrane protein|nr:hypothetical protein [Actinomycetota bacterium]